MAAKQTSVGSSDARSDNPLRWAVSRWKRWVTPYSTERQEAYRERNIRAMIPFIAALLINAIILLLSVPSLPDQRAIIWGVLLIPIACAGFAVIRGQVTLAGCLLISILAIAEIIAASRNGFWSGTVLFVAMITAPLSLILLPRRFALAAIVLMNLLYISMVIWLTVKGVTPARLITQDPLSFPLAGTVLVTFGFITVTAAGAFLLNEFDQRLHDLNEAVETLEQRVVERTRELDSFSDIVAHDLRAPLHLVIGYSGLLMDADSDSMPPSVVEYIQEIQRAGFQMNDMIQGLLMLARLRDVRGEATGVPAGPVVRSALARFQDRIEARGIQIDVESILPPALTHGAWLEEVFANLIGNAITYIGQHNTSPCIMIRGVESPPMVRYEVRDNGLGMSREVQDKLFDTFTRFHPEEGEGLGMGLSIVQRIVTRMHGTIGVDSEPGQGSTFWFTLPAAPSDTPAESPEPISHTGG